MANDLAWTSVPIPFRHAFAHASARRGEACNIVVRVRDAEGRTGHGEGCPRAYVTGETVESAHAFLVRHRAALGALADLEALRAWLGAHAADVDRNPSAACAAEFALLDLFGRRAGLSLERLLGVEPADEVAISAVYGLTPPPVFALQRLRFSLNGMTDAKLKLGRPDDLARARSLVRRGRLRLDANNLWPDADAAIPALRPFAGLAWAVEEPVAPRDWPGLCRVADATGLDVILDESFAGPADLAALRGDPRFVLNLRVSRLGGLIRALDAARRGRALGHRLIVGAQVGETGLLARAGLVLAAAAGPALTGAEIGYGPHLLRRDLVKPSPGFGRGGLMPGPPDAPGSGLSPSDTLRRAF